MNTVTDRGFGIELEMVGVTAAKAARALTAAGVTTVSEDYNHETRTHWKLVTDSSIGRSGVELVSPILKGEDGLRQVRTVCDVLTRIGATVNTKTGFHVHHDITGYTLRDWKMLLLQYIKHEDTVSAFLPVSRHANRYCKKLSTRWSSLDAAFADIQKQTTVENLMMVANGYDRYYTINVTNWSLRGSVEFRQHCGTVDADKVVSWVLLTQAMVEYAKVLRYFNTQGSESKANLFAFRRYFPEAQKTAVDGLPAYFKAKRAEELTQAMTG